MAERGPQRAGASGVSRIPAAWASRAQRPKAEGGRPVMPCLAGRPLHGLQTRGYKMIISIGPSTTLFTGFADDGDPTNGGPGTYSGGSPGACTDAGANTYAEGPGVGAPQWYMLAGRANGQSGSKASHATKAQAVASVTQAFSVDPVKAM